VTDLLQVVTRLEEGGGRLVLAGDRIRYSVPNGSPESQKLLAELRKHRERVMELLRQREAEYHASVEAALDAICRPDYPPGMILWLESADAGLYNRLTRSLPNRISYLWNAHAPLDNFQTVVDEWLATHRRACSLFITRRADESASREHGVIPQRIHNRG
jgi:hypothetical protein